jgi:hypothetical protein
LDKVARAAAGSSDGEWSGEAKENHDASTPGCCFVCFVLFGTSLLARGCFFLPGYASVQSGLLFFSPLQKQGNKLLSSSLSFLDDLNN